MHIGLFVLELFFVTLSILWREKCLNSNTKRKHVERRSKRNIRRVHICVFDIFFLYRRTFLEAVLYTPVGDLKNLFSFVFLNIKNSFSSLSLSLEILFLAWSRQHSISMLRNQLYFDRKLKKQKKEKGVRFRTHFSLQYKYAKNRRPFIWQCIKRAKYSFLHSVKKYTTVGTEKILEVLFFVFNGMHTFKHAYFFHWVFLY